MVILKFVVFLSIIFWKKSHVPTQNSEIKHDFLKIVLPMWILKFVCQVPNFTKVVTSRKLWRHKSKLNLLKYRFSTKTYPILSGFKETFWIIPSFLPSAMIGWSVACLLAFLLGCLVGWLVSWLLALLVVCLLTCSLARSSAHLLACFLVCFAFWFWLALLVWLARLARLNTRNLTRVSGVQLDFCFALLA